MQNEERWFFTQQTVVWSGAEILAKGCYGLQKKKKESELKSKLGEFMGVKLRIAEYWRVVPDSGKLWTENT